MYNSDLLKGIVFANAALQSTNETVQSQGGKLWYIDRRLHRFADDEVLTVNNGSLFFLDGYIENIDEICKKFGVEDWSEALSREIGNNNVSNLRGGFAGFVHDDNGFRLFSDHVGNRALYYYAKGKDVVISTRLYYIVEVLKRRNIKLTIDEQAVRYLVTLGFMPDDSTICRDIKRVCPGDYVDISGNGRVEIHSYFRPDNTKIQNGLKINDAIDGLDHYFRQAIAREYDKDREYGYRHLVDLSGGLDSRMTSFVAHDMGYCDQINSVFCKKGYLDQQIAEKIACDLRHKFIYMPLDDFKWFEDIEDNTAMLNAAVLYAAATGTHHILDLLKGCGGGIEHTGMVGDAIIGTFYKDKEYNYSKPDGYENAYSGFLKYGISQDILNRFVNREQYSIYTRGLLCAQSSYMLRQNFFETGSPFLDVDFLNYILSVPFEYRVSHKLYLAWINAKYPEASRFGWEKWHGARPTEKSRKFEKKVYQLKYSFDDLRTRIFTGYSRKGMTPVDYWFYSSNTKKIVDDYYAESKDILNDVLSPDLRIDIDKMYNKGNVGEKEMVITACAAARLLLE